jgi:hypothetical protein
MGCPSGRTDGDHARRLRRIAAAGTQLVAHAASACVQHSALRKSTSDFISAKFAM